MTKLRKHYPTICGQNLKPVQNLYWNQHLMSFVAYSQRNGALHMGMGADRAEALADLALRMLGHEEEAWRLKVVSS